MTISITRYVALQSTVGGANTVIRRELGGREFDSNELIPTDGLVSFTTSESAGAYFGQGSVEHLRTIFYLNWVSKDNTSPEVIQFARWVTADTEPKIFGNVQTQDINAYTAINSGSISMTIGGVTNAFTGIDFTTALTLADVATLLTAEIQAAASGGTMWTGAVVTFDAVRGSFNFVGGDAIVADISVSIGIGGQTQLGGLLGWLLGETLVVSPGALQETPVEAVSNSANFSDNFGSFLFVDALALTEIEAVALWNASVPNQVKFMYMVPVTAAQAPTYQPALITYEGTGLTLVDPAAQIPQYTEQVPMMILAATDYTRENGVQNYMFQQFDVQPTISTDFEADVYDALRINYYGVTQTAGQYIAFYQRGNLMGGITAPVGMNVYANEIWFKDAMTSALMALLLAVNRLPANKQGLSQVLANMQPIINEALSNGTISIGKVLNQAQIAFITSISNDPQAWQTVQSSGFWIEAKIEEIPAAPPEPAEFKVVYTLIYSKDDVITKIEGEQILI